VSDIKLRIEDLRKTYGTEVAVDGLSTTVEAGQLKSLLGPSGCGKTTTLRCVAGLEKPDSGRIYIDDELVSAPEEDVHVSASDRGIGMVFQSYAVWPHMTVEENVRFPLKVQKIGTKAERREQVDEVLTRVGLDKYANNLSTNLSGGQQQRVAIARALVTEPEILLFDEPLSNLDAKLRRDMRLEIKELYEEFGTTILYVTHAQDEAMFLSDDIAVMLDGKIVEEGSPVRLHNDPQTFFGMNFMGHCNTVSGTVTDRSDGRLRIDTSMGAFDVAGDGGNLDGQTDVYLCFRPKHCRLLYGEGSPRESELVIDGTLLMQAATRDFVEYQVDVGGATLLVRTTDPRPVEDGQSVKVAVDQDDVKVFGHDEGRQVIDANQADTAEQTVEPEVADD